MNLLLKVPLVEQHFRKLVIKQNSRKNVIANLLKTFYPPKSWAHIFYFFNWTNSDIEAVMK